MKNKKFFYLQYNKINWENQEKTKINSQIYKYIIKKIILNKRGDSISIFDIGFGIGLFLKALLRSLRKSYPNIIIEGCDPSRKNYGYFLREKPKRIRQGITLKTYNKTFLDVYTGSTFDFISAIYVFPHFVTEDLRKVVYKIHSMLNEGGRFILVVANQKYLERKLRIEEDLSIENKSIVFNGKKYKEILHYSDIPKIGKVIDYNREEAFYIDFFTKNRFALKYKKNINDHGFVATLFVFEKKQ